MTLIGIGKPMPAQLYLMQLAGLVIEGRHRVYDPTEDQIEYSKRNGLSELKKMTGKDFGYDVESWFLYLTEESEDDHGIKHPYGFASMKRTLIELGVDVPVIYNRNR